MLTGAFGQNLQQAETNLSLAFSKITYWTSIKLDDKTDPYDSLERVNDEFENLLLKYTSSQPATIAYRFKNLMDSGLRINTSEDGLLRIYSWDSETGGTMHSFRNVFQFKTNIATFSKVLVADSRSREGEGFYYQVNDIIAENKKFYVTQSRAILSSGLTYHNIKIFSIGGAELNDTAKLIKTKSGIRNQLGYEVDLTASSNRDNEVTDYFIVYDKINKIISLPLIQADGKVTTKKIQYQFKGKYFERL